MNMPTRMLATGCISGIVAALWLSLLQAFWTTPLILEAETYETRAEAAQHVQTAATALNPEHEDDAWQPELGWQRTLATVSGNIAMAVGFALMLTGTFCLRRPAPRIGGLAWGLAGYAVFFAAPSLGLPPELPGSTAANLLARQSWWLGTACATLIGLGLLLLQDRKILKIAGTLLLLMPHLIGAPRPAIAESLVPAALQSQFVLATAVCNLLFWLVLGGLSAALAIRVVAADQSDTPSSPEKRHG